MDKSKRVLLVFPRIDGEKEYHHLPVSGLSVAAPLVRLGIEFDIFDQRVDDPARLDELLDDAFIVGVTMFTGYQTHCGYEILKKVRASHPDIITVVGGPHVTALPQQTIADKHVDFAISGFGEAPFSDLIVELLENGKDNVKAIPGLSRKNMIEVAIEAPSKKFDATLWDPLPYDKINLASYINEQTKRVMYVAHYGCPARCTFCATPHYRKWVPKPMEFVRQDLATLHDNFAFEQICFFDATLFTDKKRVEQIVGLLDSEYPGVTWMGDARAVELNKYTTEELIEINNKNVNLSFLIVGLESGSAYIAEEVMKKGKKHLEMFKGVAERMHLAGIKMISGLIFGIPGETTEDLKKTIDYISEIREIHPAFRLSSTFFRPLPGTELYGILDEQGYIKPKSLADWAAHGESSHFKYHEWMDIPWLAEAEKTKYRKQYEVFREVHGDILE